MTTPPGEARLVADLRPRLPFVDVSGSHPEDLRPCAKRTRPVSPLERRYDGVSKMPYVNVLVTRPSPIRRCVLVIGSDGAHEAIEVGSRFIRYERRVHVPVFDAAARVVRDVEHLPHVEEGIIRELELDEPTSAQPDGLNGLGRIVSV